MPDAWPGHPWVSGSPESRGLSSDCIRRFGNVTGGSWEHDIQRVSRINRANSNGEGADLGRRGKVIARTLRPASAKPIGGCGAGREFAASDRVPETAVGLCCWVLPWGAGVLGRWVGMVPSSVVL